MNKNDFTFGDLVSVTGYHPQVFSISGYRSEHYYYPGEDWPEMVYELYDVATGEWIEADEMDLTLLADAGQADEYLRANPAPVVESGLFAQYLNFDEEDDIMFMFGGFSAPEPKKPAKPTARELSAKAAAEKKAAAKEREAKIDALLDEMNDTKVMVEMFPEDDEYKAKVEYLILKLAEISAGHIAKN